MTKHKTSKQQLKTTMIKNQLKYELVPPNIHRHSAVEQAITIHTFINHFNPDIAP